MRKASWEMMGVPSPVPQNTQKGGASFSQPQWRNLPKHLTAGKDNLAGVSLVAKIKGAEGT